MILHSAPRLLAVALLSLSLPPAAMRAEPPSAARARPIAAARPLVVGYLPQWGLYNSPPWVAHNLVASGAAALLDQVDYAQGTVRGGRCVIADPEADLNHVYLSEMSIDGKADLPTAPLRGGLHQLQLLRARYPRLRALLSLEGKASEFATAAQPQTRAAFVSSCIDMFLRGHFAPGLQAPGLFDGLDLDWEFPATPADGENYTALVAEFRRQLDNLAREQSAAAAGSLPKRYALTLAVGPGLGRYPGVDWKQVEPMVDEIGLMNYDYNGPWQQQTGMLAPLYTIDGDPHPHNTVDATVQEYEGAGIPASKLLVGVPFYGYHWTAVQPTPQPTAQPGTQPTAPQLTPGSTSAANHGLFQSARAVHADTPYSEIAAEAGHSTLFRDEHSQTPWLFDGQTFWTFDDPVSARAKAAYVATHGLKGVMIWELSGDTADAQLLRAIAAGLAR